MPQPLELVALTGAGISAESGLKTFRDRGGLWENFDVYEVASIEGWRKNPVLVHQFYDMRRQQAWKAEPNAGHRVLAALERFFNVTIITQNVDRLHEKAGSSRVIHLHGDLFSAKSSVNGSVTREIADQPLPAGIPSGDGGVWRPNIVWFGENVPLIEKAAEIVEKADIFLIIGTSLQVYPAAGLLSAARYDADIWLADPNADEIPVPKQVKVVAKPATFALPFIEKELMNRYIPLKI